MVCKKQIQFVMFVLAVLFSSFLVISSFADTCPRYAPGTLLNNPPNIYSSHSYLDLHATYESRWDENYNLTLFCYMNANNQQSPTLRVAPGDTILFTLKNNANLGPDGDKMELPNPCGSKWIQEPAATNIHFHGLHSPPSCHIEDTSFTVINYGEEYTYDLHIPITQPPGLYWYHPHIHGLTERSVQGGASGAIVVEGIENLQPAVSGLPEQILILRDYSSNIEDYPHPTFEITANYHYIPYPNYTPILLHIKPNEKQFWRILNAASDAIFQLQFIYDDVIQPVDVVSHDGIIHHDKDHQPSLLLSQSSLYLDPAGRVEIILQTPSLNVTTAYLKTLYVNTGPEGDYDPERNILQLIPTTSASSHEIYIPQPTHHSNLHDQTSQLFQKQPNRVRKLYFSSTPENETNPESDTLFFITIDDQIPVPFTINSLIQAPSVTVIAETVEDWILENHAQEIHVFHIHQLHFLLLEVNGVKVLEKDLQFYDTLTVPYWDGVSQTYPSITMRMFFSKDIIGKFVYHCHILEHEDKGMMAVIEVINSSSSTALSSSPTSSPSSPPSRSNGSSSTNGAATLHSNTVVILLIVLITLLGLILIILVIMIASKRSYSLLTMKAAPPPSASASTSDPAAPPSHTTVEVTHSLFHLTPSRSFQEINI